MHCALEPCSRVGHRESAARPGDASAVGSKDWIDHDPSRWMESARAVAESGAPLTRPRRVIRLNESCVQPANGSKQETPVRAICRVLRVASVSPCTRAVAARRLSMAGSVASAVNHRQWFQPIWTGLTGASTTDHPAPYPVELAERLIRMFSFAGDTILDPFGGTGTTTLAASRVGRHSISVEIDDQYFALLRRRLAACAGDCLSNAQVIVH